jgi:hypothetical protein
VSWSARFDEPIPLPRGRQLVTLQDAGKYITKLPKAEHDAPEWQVAMEALILVATHGGPTMFARIGVMQALNRHHIRGTAANTSKGANKRPAKPTAKLSNRTRPSFATQSPDEMG